MEIGTIVQTCNINSRLNGIYGVIVDITSNIAYFKYRILALTGPEDIKNRHLGVDITEMVIPTDQTIIDDIMGKYIAWKMTR